MMAGSVWIINPYGTLPTESWATYRSTMLADCLVDHGFAVRQFISNVDHRSKAFRTAGPETMSPRPGYDIEIVPSTPYESHVSLARIRYERTFARNLLQAVRSRPRPDAIVLAEPALFYYDVLRPLLSGPGALVLDIIDIWPEIFEMVLPRPLRPLSRILLSPLYAWRKNLYRRAAAVVAVAEDYLRLARTLAPHPGVIFEVVYWAYDDRRRGSTADASAAVVQLVSGKDAGEVWGIYAGTLGENYDIHSLVDVARRLPGDLRGRARLKILVAGDGPLRGLVERNANQDLLFLGRVGAADLALLYDSCDFALSTYKRESTVAMPIKAFDYMRHGLPIVNSLGRDLGAIVRERDIGINYTPSSVSSLYEAVGRLATDDELRRRCSANASKLAPEFSSARQYAKFASVLQRVCQSRASTQ